MSEGFYQLQRGDKELVKLGKLTVEEFGFRDLLAAEVNPHNGYCLSNFTMLAYEWNEKPARVKYVLEKLKSLGLVYYEIRQGQKTKSYFFVMGLEMVRKGNQPCLVTPEYIAKATDYSEVKTHFQKLESPGCIEASQEASRSYSEVAYKEKDNNKEKEMDMETNTDIASLLKKISSSANTIPTVSTLPSEEDKLCAEEHRKFCEQMRAIKMGPGRPAC